MGGGGEGWGGLPAQQQKNKKSRRDAGGTRDGPAVRKAMRSAPIANGGRTAMRKTGGLLREAGDGGGFAVVGVEDGHELRDLQHFFELRSQVGELQGGTLGAGAVEGGYESA